MSARPDLLSTTRLVLRMLVYLNFLFGGGIAALLAASFAAPSQLQIGLGFHAGAPPSLMIGLRLIMVIGLCTAMLAYLYFKRTLSIVQTVRDGDPFVPENARALQVIAWLQLGGELLNLAVGAVSKAVSTPADPLDLGWDSSVEGWLAVLLLFVLARVFQLGTQMRADLQGTV